MTSLGQFVASAYDEALCHSNHSDAALHQATRSVLALLLEAGDLEDIRALLAIGRKRHAPRRRSIQHSGRAICPQA
jgi:hypothetical protein